MTFYHRVPSFIHDATLHQARIRHLLWPRLAGPCLRPAGMPLCHRGWWFAINEKLGMTVWSFPRGLCSLSSEAPLPMHVPELARRRLKRACNRWRTCGTYRALNLFPAFSARVDRCWCFFSVMSRVIIKWMVCKWGWRNLHLRALDLRRSTCRAAANGKHVDAPEDPVGHFTLLCHYCVCCNKCFGWLESLT